MIRRIHSWVALPATLFILLVTLSGSLLSSLTLYNEIKTPKIAKDSLSVAELSENLLKYHQGVEQLRRTNNGQFIVTFDDGVNNGEHLLDPNTGKSLSAYSVSPFYNWIKSVHRSFLLDSPGRALAGLIAGLMLCLIITGTVLLIRRSGGIKYLIKRSKGRFTQVLHSELGKIAMLGGLIASVSGLYLSAITFSILPEPPSAEPDFPDQFTSTSIEKMLPTSSLKALQHISAHELLSLEWPYDDDPESLYYLETYDGAGYISPFTGELLNYKPHSSFYSISQFIKALHTGEGLGYWSLLLLITSLSLSGLAASGLFIWFGKRTTAAQYQINNPRDNQSFLSTSSKEAKIVILVGSEGNTTQSFAEHFANQLFAFNKQILLSTLNQCQSSYPSAEHVFILTSTYGQGQAPNNATQFLGKSGQMLLPTHCSVNVLGFGDTQFTYFAGFAKEVEHKVRKLGFKKGVEFTAIDRGDRKQLEDWCNKVSVLLDHPIKLAEIAATQSHFSMKLVESDLYGEEVEAPVKVLKFTPTASQTLDYKPGDLVGICPPGSNLPRYYSLASSSSSNFIEICVRKQENGLCSSLLHDIDLNEAIDAFIVKKPLFKPSSSANGIILIGAGTGLGPLKGFINENKDRVPYTLYWGGRLASSDFLYESFLKNALNTDHLKKLRLAFSRCSINPMYVQDLIDNDSKEIAQSIGEGAQILVCGSKVMARGVRQKLDTILASSKVSISELEAKGQYLEDVY